MARLWQTTLAAGEVSPEIAARFDSELYGQAAGFIENLAVRPEGGVTRLPGSEFIAAAKFADKRARLIPFKRANDDAVMVEAGEGYFRLYDALTGAALAQAEIATGFDLQTVDGLYAFQSADVMYLTCKTGRMAPRVLRRFSDASWSLATLDIQGGPFMPENFDAGVLSSNALTGTATVTGFAGLLAGHVGARFRVWTTNYGRPFEKWEAEKAVVVSRFYEHDGRVYTTPNASTTSRQPPVHDGGLVPDRDPRETTVVNWLYEHDLSGVFRIIAVQSASAATVDIEEKLPQPLISGASATNRWAEGYFSDARGWPFVGGIFGSRLYFAGAPQFPDTLWASRIDGFNPSTADFKQSAGSGEVLDDHAVVRTLNDSEVNRIAWFVAGEQILLGHAGGIVRVTGPSVNEPITPAGASALRPDGPPGASFGARAIRADAAVIYASTSGRRVIALDPRDFSHRTLSARLRALGAARFIDFAYLAETESRLFALREDGALFICAFDVELGLAAWSRAVPAGAFDGGPALVDAIAAAPGPDGRDRLWMIVRRTIGGQEKRFVERMATDFDAGARLPEEAVMSDAAKVYDFWNRDPLKTVTLSVAGGAANALRDVVATLTLSGWTMDASWIGKTLILRKRNTPPREADFSGDVRLTVLTQAGASATARLDVDCPAALHGVGLSQWAQGRTSLSGLAHLDGASVGVWGDGADLGDATVAAGAIALDDAVAYAVIGLRKPWRLKSLPLTLARPDGPSRGDPVKASRAYVDLRAADLAGVRVSLIADGRATATHDGAARDLDDMTPAVPPLKSGFLRCPIGSGSARRVEIEVSGAGLGPVQILAMGLDAA